jgi:hypothetical protein
MFAMVFKYFQMFLQLFQTHVLSVSSVFRRILQVLHLDVSKVDRILHMLQCARPVVAAEAARGVRQGVEAAWGRAGAQTPCGVGWAQTPCLVYQSRCFCFILYK